MIPTAIIVNDNNKKLHDLEELLKGIVRVFHRTSLQGEELYGIFEGVIFFDENGQKQMTRKDVYGDVVPQILSKVKGSTSVNQALLKEYLKGIGMPLVSSRAINDLEEGIQADLNAYLSEMYG